MIRWIAFVGLCVAASNSFAYMPGAVSSPMGNDIRRSDLKEGGINTEDEAKVESPKQGEILLWRGERWMLDMVNWHRARAGMKPVKIDPKVQERCRAHCYWMARTGSMTHSGRSGENIAAGQHNVAAAVQAWVNDPPHAVQIFDAGKTVIGVACYQSPGGSRFYCMEAH